MVAISLFYRLIFLIIHHVITVIYPTRFYSNSRVSCNNSLGPPLSGAVGAQRKFQTDSHRLIFLTIHFEINRLIILIPSTRFGFPNFVESFSEGPRFVAQDGGQRNFQTSIHLFISTPYISNNPPQNYPYLFN